MTTAIFAKQPNQSEDSLYDHHAAALATAHGIKYVKDHGNGDVKSLQELHSEIKAK